MGNSKEVLFGQVADEQRDYWQRNQLNQRDAAVLDQHFDNRARGGKWQQGISAYSIPRAQKAALKESRIGGILQVEGGDQFWEAEYLKAQAKLSGQSPSIPDPWGGRNPGSVPEVDMTALLQQRMRSQGSPGNSFEIPGQQQPARSSLCTLQEGHTFYSPLKVEAFGTTQPLAKTGGTIKGVQGRQFQIEGQVTAYVVDGLQTVDLSKMDPSRLKPLYRVTAPLLGTFLVPQEAIQELSGNGMVNGGRQLLIDSGQQHRVEQLRMNQQQMLQQQQQQQQQRQGQGQSRLLTSQPSSQQQPRPTNPQEILQQQSRELLRRRGMLKG